MDTAMAMAMAKALKAKDAAVPKANPVTTSPKKGFRSNQNSQEGTGKFKHADGGC